MAIINLKDLAHSNAKGKPILGLDVGSKTIGLAISDSRWQIASQLHTIRRVKFSKDILELQGIIADLNIGSLVVGMPVNMDGTKGPRAQSTQAFSCNVLKSVDLPLAFWDERLSTSAVERQLIDQDMSRAKRANVIDQHAAQYILQGALDRLQLGWP